MSDGIGDVIARIRAANERASEAFGQLQGASEQLAEARAIMQGVGGDQPGESIRNYQAEISKCDEKVGEIKESIDRLTEIGTNIIARLLS
jgi:hypothetical protein